MQNDLDAETVKARLHLWFFRDLSEEQRLRFLKLCYHPATDADFPTHAAQKLALRGLVALLSAKAPSHE